LVSRDTLIKERVEIRRDTFSYGAVRRVVEGRTVGGGTSGTEEGEC
jgi:hypothetical protein